MHGGPARVEAHLITGTVGVGTTTTARVIGEQLQKLAIPHAVIDLDVLALRLPGGRLAEAPWVVTSQRAQSRATEPRSNVQCRLITAV